MEMRRVQTQLTQMSGLRLENAHFKIIGPNEGRFYFRDSSKDNYEFFFKVRCNGTKMETYQLLSTNYHNYRRDTIRKETESGITLNMMNRKLPNHQADKVFAPIWRRYLEGRPYEDADFFM